MGVKGVKGLKSVGLGGVGVGQALGERCWRVLGFWWIKNSLNLRRASSKTCQVHTQTGLV